MLYVNQERMKHVSCLSSFNYISWQLNNRQKKTRLYQTLIVDEEGLIQLRDRPFIISNKIMGQASLVARAAEACLQCRRHTQGRRPAAVPEGVFRA